MRNKVDQDSFLMTHCCTFRKTMSESVLLKIFSQDRKPGTQSSKLLIDYKSYESIDVDAANLLEHFGNKAHFHRNMTANEIKQTIGEIENKYDVLIFVFLTYLSRESELNQQTNNEERVDCWDGPMKLEEIFDLIKNKELFIGKQKIFLVQADDLVLLYPDEVPKGPRPLPEPIRIPRDSDRLVIFSTLPQQLSSMCSVTNGVQNLELSDKKGRGCRPPDEPPQPSMLIQAFVETLTEAYSKDEDLLTQTARMNGKVDKMIQLLKEAKPEFASSPSLQVPLITSTLRKAVHITTPQLSKSLLYKRS